jgi:hypothetical protein
LPVPDEAADRVALKGIDESIASFGHTAKGRESDEIIAPLLAFFAAKASGDYARACGLLESYMYRQLAYAAKQEKPGRLKHKNCSGVMEALLEPISHRFLSQAAQIDVALVKVESNRAYVVYSTPGVSSAIMYMHRESGEWMVGKIDADRLL